jgi:hypothetical protein
MVSDFLTSEWGRLYNGKECVPFFFHPLFFITQCHDREACIFFKAGKNRDGWFGLDDLMTQVDKAINIFKGLTKGHAQGLFLFDNAPSHQKCAPNAISAWKMVKGASYVTIFFLSFFLILIVHAGSKEGWAHYPDRPCMCDGKLLTGEDQSFYFPDEHPTMAGWFKRIVMAPRGRVADEPFGF